MKAPSYFPSGFTLVEIVFAMGVISFAIMAVLGLLSMEQKSSRSSLDETLVAAMSRQVMGDLRRKPFASIASGTDYFDANGISAPMESAVYQCTVTVTQSTPTDFLKYVTLKFSWPVGAAHQSISVYATQAKYY